MRKSLGISSFLIFGNFFGNFFWKFFLEIFFGNFFLNFFLNFLGDFFWIFFMKTRSVAEQPASVTNRGLVPACYHQQGHGASIGVERG
jgi:hypothetical protein